VSVITEEKIAAVDTLVQDNRRITVQELSTAVNISMGSIPYTKSCMRIWAMELSMAVNISMGSIHQILHAHLGYQKVCAQWVPKHLTDEKKNSGWGFAWKFSANTRWTGKVSWSRL
jgi:hypothetical protein